MMLFFDMMQIRMLRLVRKYLVKTHSPAEWRWRADYMPVVAFKKSSERRPWSAAEDFFILFRASSPLLPPPPRALPAGKPALGLADKEGGGQGSPARTDQPLSSVAERVAPGMPEVQGKGNHTEMLPDWSQVALEARCLRLTLLFCFRCRWRPGAFSTARVIASLSLLCARCLSLARSPPLPPTPPLPSFLPSSPLFPPLLSTLPPAPPALSPDPTRTRIRHRAGFKFDWFFKSRTPLELFGRYRVIPHLTRQTQNARFYT